MMKFTISVECLSHPIIMCDLIVCLLEVDFMTQDLGLKVHQIIKEHA